MYALLECAATAAPPASLSAFPTFSPTDRDAFSSLTPTANPSRAPAALQATGGNIEMAVRAYLSNKEQAIRMYGPINEWDVSRVTSIQSLFKDATNFDEDVADWAVASLQDMRGMFSTAAAFSEFDEGSTIIIKNGKVKVAGAGRVAVWSAGQPDDCTAKVISVDPKLRGFVCLQSARNTSTKFENPGLIALSRCHKQGIYTKWPKRWSRAPFGWKDWAIPHAVRTYKLASSATATCSAEGLEAISDVSMCEAAAVNTFTRNAAGGHGGHCVVQTAQHIR